jgi:hypothetical protein
MKSIVCGGYTFMVNDDDFDRLSPPPNWSVCVGRRKDGSIKRVYAMRNVDGKTHYLHRDVLGVTDTNTLVDHRDRNTFNCQKFNLRACTRADNQRNSNIRPNNTSGAKGVSWDESRQLWSAQIHYENRKYFLGRFIAFDNAVAAYDYAAIMMFGEFASPSENSKTVKVEKDVPIDEVRKFTRSLRLQENARIHHQTKNGEKIKRVRRKVIAQISLASRAQDVIQFA